MEESEAIMVDRPVYNQFQTILTETQFTSNGLMKHFFQLYNSSLNQIYKDDAEGTFTNQTHMTRGDNFSKVVVNIPKRLLRRDISVNVTVPDNSSCITTDSDDSSEDYSNSGSLICDTAIGMDENIYMKEIKNSCFPEMKTTKVTTASLKEAVIIQQHQTYNCNFCTFKTKGLRKYRNHIRKHSEQQLYCPFCDKIFLDQSKLKHHVKVKHETLDLLEKYRERNRTNNIKCCLEEKDIKDNLSEENAKKGIETAIISESQHEYNRESDLNRSVSSLNVDEFVQSMEVTNTEQDVSRRGDNYSMAVGGIDQEVSGRDVNCLEDFGNTDQDVRDKEVTCSINFHNINEDVSRKGINSCIEMVSSEEDVTRGVDNSSYSMQYQLHSNNLLINNNTSGEINETPGKRMKINVEVTQRNGSVKRKQFICNLCGAVFPNLCLYINHRVRCRQNKFQFICKCKMKFRWKSVFLHHKKKCTPRKFMKLQQNLNFGKSKVADNHKQYTDNTHKRNEFQNSNFGNDPTNFERLQYITDDVSAFGLIPTDKSEEMQHVNTPLNEENETLYMKSCEPENEEKVDTRKNEVLSSLVCRGVASSSHLSSLIYDKTSNDPERLDSGEINQTMYTNNVISESDDRTCVRHTPDKEVDILDTDIVVENSTSKDRIKTVQCNTLDQNAVMGNLKSKLSAEDIAEKEPSFHTHAIGINSKAEIDVDLSHVKQEPLEPLEQIHTLLQKGDQLSIERLIEAASLRESIDAQMKRSSTEFPAMSSTFPDSMNFINYAVDDGEANLKCEECGEIFKRKAYLKEHIEGKHGGDLRYTCDCGKKFKWRSSLGNHRKNCYQALLSVLPPEVQTQGQSVSVIDLSQCGIPYMNIHNEWVQEMEKITKSILSPRKEPSSNHDQESRQRHVSSPGKNQSENQNFLTHRRKSDSLCSSGTTNDHNSSLRIDTSVVKPFADAVTKYKQKPTVPIYGSRNPEEKKSPLEKHTSYQSVIYKPTSIHSNFKSNQDGHSDGVIDLTKEYNASQLNRQTHSNNQCSKLNVPKIPSANVPSNNREFGSCSAEKSRTATRAKSSDFTYVKQSYPQQRRKSIHFPQAEAVECSFCREKFSSVSELERHKLYCRHLQDTCSVCGKKFQHRTDLINHLLTYHGNDETYTCFCGMTSSDWNFFEKHCERCEVFKTQSSSFSSPEKNKKPRSDVRPSTNQNFPMKNLSESQQTLKPKLDTKSLTNQHYSLEHLSRNEQAINLRSDKRSITSQHFITENSLDNQHISSSRSGTKSSTNQIFTVENSSDIQHISNPKSDTKSSTNQHFTVENSLHNDQMSNLRSDTRTSTNQHFIAENSPHNQQMLSPRSDTKSSMNQHFTAEIASHNHQILNSRSDSKSLTNQHISTESHVQSQQIIQQKQQNNMKQVSSMPSINMLPTISSFVMPTAENKGANNFTNIITNNQSLLPVRDGLNQTKPKKNDADKKDVYVCTFCGNVYNSLDKFSEHDKMHHGNQILFQDKNKQMKTAVDDAINKARHLSVKMAEHVCHLCGDVFAAKAYLKEHVSGKHGTVDRYKCPCGMRFKWRSSLGIHQKKCPKSNKRTYNRWNSS